MSVDLRVRLVRGALTLESSLRSTADRLAVVAPSGAGKTTVLRILAGLEPDTSGSLRVRGETWLDTSGGVNRPPWERGVGWMPQDALLLPHLTVRGNLEQGRAGEDSTRLLEAAAATECDHLLERRPRHLSGGERQRVALARALLAARSLLLLDEPFSALDAGLRERIVREVDRWVVRDELSLVLASHDDRDPGALGCERWSLREGSLERLADS